MKTYNFDKVINRDNTDSIKWDLREKLFGSKDVIPMWIADMDFPVADEIIEAVNKRSEHGVFGYTIPGDSATDVVIRRMKDLYNWEIKKDWIVFTPGIVPALFAAVKAFAHPGDEVLIQTPVYYPFFSSIKNNGCHVVENTLVLKNGRYEMDFDDLENKLKYSDASGSLKNPSRVKIIFLCSPHNPVGRVWSKDELVKLGELASKYNVLVLSDEIHGEIIFDGFNHIPFASLSKEFEKNSITCISPSKTFNLAGLGASAIIIPDPDLRKNFNNSKYGIMPLINCFGVTSFEAAYKHGDKWLSEFLFYIQENFKFLKKFINEKIPDIKVIEPEGTYLIWLDFRKFNLGKNELTDFIQKKAKLGLEDGFIYGESGTGFQRMNIACSRSVLKQALERLEKAVSGI